MDMKGILADVRLEIVKRIYRNGTDAMRLHEILDNYINRQSLKNFESSVESEIDYEGLVSFLRGDFAEEMAFYLSKTSPGERGRLRESILSSAYTHAKAKNPAAKHRVTRFVSDIIKIYQEFYKHKLPKECFVIAAETVDAVNEHTDQKVSELEKQISVMTDSITELKASADEIIIVPKDTDALEKLLQRTMDLYSAAHPHPLAPEYGYNHSGEHVLSMPLTAEALLKYPPNIAVDGPVRMGNKLIPELSPEVLQYAYRHQQPMTISVINAKKFLGSVEDPVQSEAEAIVGTELVIKPPEFPEAVPCSFAAGEIVFYDYVLLRQQEILDDGSLVFGNKEQNAACYFELKTCKQFSETVHFDFRPVYQNNSLDEALVFEQFTLALWEGQPLRIKNLQSGEILLKGNLIHNENHDITALREEIEFLGKMKTVEDYYHIGFILPHEYSAHEEHVIDFLAQLVSGREITENWKQRSFMGPVSEQFRLNLKKYGDIEFTGRMRINETYQIFGAELNVECDCILNDMKYKDYDKLVKIADLLEDGENIKLDFVPGEDTTVCYKIVDA